MFAGLLIPRWTFLLAVSTLTSPSAVAQDRPVHDRIEQNTRRYEQHSEDRGTHAAFVGLQAALLKPAYGADEAGLFARARDRSFVARMALLGFGPADAAGLKARGFDLLGVMSGTQSSVTDPQRLALLSERLVIGTVVDTYNSLVPEDGFRTSVLISVTEELVGPPAPDGYLILRLTSGQTADGGYAELSSDPVLAIGEEYLLAVSNGRYRYAAWRLGGAVALPASDLGVAQRVRLSSSPPIPIAQVSSEDLDVYRGIGSLLAELRENR